MAPHLFWLKYFSQLPLYFIILFLSSLVHWFLFRKYIIGILDPLFLLVFGFVFNLSTLVFVFFVTDGPGNTLHILLAMHVFCYAGFYVFAPKTIKIRSMLSGKSHDPKRPKLNFCFFLLFTGALFFLFATCIEYSVAGIPLFRTSRQGVFSDTGLGVVTRFEDIGFIFISILIVRLILLQKLCNAKWKFVCMALLTLIFITSVLSGSKGAFVSFVSIGYLFYVINYLHLHNRMPKLLTARNIVIAMLLVSSAIVAIIMHPASGNVFNDVTTSKSMLGILGFFYRLVNFGDIYVYSFVDDALNSIPSSGGLISLFSGILSTFRIVSPDDIPVHLGYDLALKALPGLDVVSGPNANFNVFGFHYFGATFGLLFSFLVGLFVGWCRYILLASVPAILYDNKASLSTLVFVFGLIGAGLPIDPPYSISRLISFIIVGLLVFMTSYIVYYGTIHHNRFSKSSS